MRKVIKDKQNKKSVKQRLKKLLWFRIASLQAEKGQFVRNPAFAENVKTANIALIESEIASLERIKK